MGPRMRTGSILVTNRMHNEFVRIWGVGLFFPYAKFRIWGSPYAYGESQYAYGQGSPKYAFGESHYA